jgi:hypothetical protein
VSGRIRMALLWRPRQGNAARGVKFLPCLPGRTAWPDRLPANIPRPADKKRVESAAERRPASESGSQFTRDHGYPASGGEWGLVALLVFKTSDRARARWRVRFPSASAHASFLA